MLAARPGFRRREECSSTVRPRVTVQTGFPSNATQRVVNLSKSPVPALPGIVVDRLGRALIGPEGVRVELPYLSLRLLESLADVSPNFVLNATLLGRVWPDTHIGADALKQRVRLLRVSLSDAGYDAKLLDSVRGEGYALRARLIDAAVVMPDSPDQPRAEATAAGTSLVVGGHPHFATWQRILLATLVVVAMSAAATLAYRGGASGQRRESVVTTMGSAPVRVGVAALNGNPAAAQLMDLLGNTPNLLLVPVLLPGSPAGADACAATELVHLCLSVVANAGGYTIALTQRRSGAMLIRETVSASGPSLELAALRIAQFATPGVLRWLGGSGRGDVAFDLFRRALRALQECDTVLRSESIAELRQTAARSPDFLPARALLAALSVEAAGAVSDSGQIALVTAEAVAVLTRMPDLSLAQLAIARGAALRGDTVAAKVSMSRAARLLPLLDRFYDESAQPRSPSRCERPSSN